MGSDPESRSFPALRLCALCGEIRFRF